jgi:hypothetical protein
MSGVIASVLASEASGGGDAVSPYVFGAFGFAALVGLLIITVMINVDR